MKMRAERVVALRHLEDEALLDVGEGVELVKEAVVVALLDEVVIGADAEGRELAARARPAPPRDGPTGP